MNVSTADYLKVAAPYLEPTLVSQTALFDLQAFAQSLPPISISAFECRLDEQTRVDFSVCTPCTLFNLPDGFVGQPIWQSFSDFCQNWTNSETGLREIVNYVWLEFDRMGIPSPVPIPCIALTLNPETAKDDRLTNLAIGHTLKQFNASDALAIASKVKFCVDRLPKSAKIAHIGAMLSRPVQVVRLVIKGILPQQLSDYLQQIGWSEPTHQLDLLITQLSNHVDEMALAFDVSDRIHPLIGLECFKRSNWESFLDDYLVKENLCTLQKRDALLKWPGLSQKADHPALWPSHLNYLDQLFSAKAYSIFNRTLNHIKIVYQPHHPLSAKAYLFLEHLYLRHDELAQKNS